MGKKGPLWWRESDWLLRGSSAANQILSAIVALYSLIRQKLLKFLQGGNTKKLTQGGNTKKLTMLILSWNF